MYILYEKPFITLKIIGSDVEFSTNDSFNTPFANPMTEYIRI